ncbi:MAG: lipid IV(A) 3-deoxy-D-manno-octulosonic acid transferase [Vibrio sp.]
MLLRSIYSLLFFILTPFVAFSLYKPNKNKPAFGSRWKEHFGITPSLKDQTKQPIWIHTVSVGETIAATPFIRALKQKHPETPIVITTTTSTGAQQAEKLSDIAEHRYMPVDLPFAIKHFIKTIQPQTMLIMETELWPNALHYVGKANIPIIVINARLSERSAHRYKKFHSVFNLLSKNLSMVLCQHNDDATRFNHLGLNELKLQTTGSLKFDISISDDIKTESQKLRTQLGISRPIWIAASTHDGEDEQVLAAHSEILRTNPNALLILVPRHPERFDSVYNLCSEKGFITKRRTDSSNNSYETCQVYLGDTMGEMLLLLASSDVCFMGGSLIGDKVGGHNLLEPAALGIPSITGPSFYNFTDITQQLSNADACFICNDHAELSEKILLLFENSALRDQYGQNALKVINSNTGAIERSIKYIEPFIS